MKVYVLLRHTFDGVMVWGVYKSKATAQEWVDSQDAYTQSACEVIERIVVAK